MSFRGSSSSTKTNCFRKRRCILRTGSAHTPLGESAMWCANGGGGWESAAILPVIRNRRCWMRRMEINRSLFRYFCGCVRKGRAVTATEFQHPSQVTKDWTSAGNAMKIYILCPANAGKWAQNFARLENFACGSVGPSGQYSPLRCCGGDDRAPSDEN